MRKQFTATALALVCMVMFAAQSSTALSVSATVKGSLPSLLVESSACDYTGGTHFWSLNDSGDPSIHRIADDGTLTKTITITNANNRNWEEITHDVNRNYMFIGDFGNNNCDRTNLKIYRIPYPNSASPSTMTADQICYSYPDQHRFPSPWMNFDVEAFIHFGGQLFLFTKADGSAIGYTKMYVLPDVPGTYVAMLVDSFYTNDRITGAAISPDQSTVCLIANTRIHLFRGFTGNDFFHGNHTLISIQGGWTQKEGVTFGSNNEIYMTDENSGGGNHLYYVDLSPWVPAQSVILGTENVVKEPAVAYPNPANAMLTINLKRDLADASVSISDLTGKIVYNSPITNTSTPFHIDTATLPQGIYFYRIYSEGKEVQTDRILVSH
jgi:hypothetical protein